MQDTKAGETINHGMKLRGSKHKKPVMMQIENIKMKRSTNICVTTQALRGQRQTTKQTSETYECQRETVESPVTSSAHWSATDGSVCMEAKLKERFPWVVVTPAGVYWLGHAEDEAQAWSIALGWPDKDEIDAWKAKGCYAAQATVTWNKP